jgi:hypothetical protein
MKIHRIADSRRFLLESAMAINRNERLIIR